RERGERGREQGHEREPEPSERDAQDHRSRAPSRIQRRTISSSRGSSGRRSSGIWAPTGGVRSASLRNSSEAPGSPGTIGGSPDSPGVAASAGVSSRYSPRRAPPTWQPAQRSTK